MFLDDPFVLIFGGCCSNVFALEAIVKHEPDSGLLITVTQLAIVSLITLPSQLTHTQSRRTPSGKDGTLDTSLFSYRFRTPKLPFHRLAVQALLFSATNILNNWAFAFDISVPLHIILRSFGSVMTLLVGWLVGKKYSSVQVGAVVALTAGVVTSAWADAKAKGAKMDLTASPSASASSFASGLGILFIAQLLGAIQGVYTEQTYTRHGRHWGETLFYSHLFGTLFSLSLLPRLLRQLQRLVAGPRATIPTVMTLKVSELLSAFPAPFNRLSNVTSTLLARMAPWSGLWPSQSICFLLLNAATQFACITGVNKLSATTTAVTVTVVLNIRKLASFLLSCWIFGNKIDKLMQVGAATVFVSGAVYGWDSGRRKGGGQKKEKEEVVDGRITNHSQTHKGSARRRRQ